MGVPEDLMAKGKATQKKKMAKRRTPFDCLRERALALPETGEDHPWGETAFKVRGKVFLFVGNESGTINFTLKLPRSREFALEYPFTKPSGYGLGKSGWVTATFTAKEKFPLDLLSFWLLESYRAVAPKKLVTELDRTS
jgi:predicted DNA-binding protein (MmcQ/YjbR family)